MNPVRGYNGSLTREQFLFHEIRVTANLLNDGYTKEEALKVINAENLFQFPTERMVSSIAKTCFRRFDALASETLKQGLSSCSADVARLINLYAIMRDNKLVYDFMTTVIGEKYRSQDFELSSFDINVYIMELQEQHDHVRGWSDNTVKKIKQVLRKFLLECGYIVNIRSEILEPVYLYPELEDGIKENGDYTALSAFNHFE